MLVGSMTFHEFHADLHRIASGNLPVADDAIERCAYFRALQLLPRDCHAALGGLEVALRIVAANLRVLQILGRHQVARPQLREALELPFGLLVGPAGGARRGLRGVEVSPGSPCRPAAGSSRRA